MQSNRDQRPGVARRLMLAGTMLAGLMSCLAGASSGGAAEAARELKWADLVPPAPPRPPKAFFAGRPPSDASSGTRAELPLESGPEGRWLSAPVKPAGPVLPPAVVETLNGQTVRLGGYVVPLDFDATSVKEFLLVPFVGACIHVPPPPANQIVYVKTAKGFDVKGMFDPVTVTGKLSTSYASTGLADAGYTLEAEGVEARTE